MEIDNPIFISENDVTEVANLILTIKIGIIEVVIQRVRGHGSRDRKFITQKKVLEIANPIFTPLNEVLEVAIPIFTPLS